MRGLSCCSTTVRSSVGGTQGKSTHSFREGALVSEGEDIEGNEKSIQELVRQNRVKAFQPQTQDVLDVIEMVQVLRH